MKKKAIAILSVLVIVCMGFCTSVYGSDPFELPSIPIKNNAADVGGIERDADNDPFEADSTDPTVPTADTTWESSEIPFSSTTKPANKVTKPKATKIVKLKKGKKSFTVTWKKVKGIKGYQVQYSTTKKFKKKVKGKKQVVKTVTIKKAKTVKKTVKKLKRNKKYFVRVRTYKVVNGKKYYSKWSKVKAVKTK